MVKHTMICTTTKARTPEDPNETEKRESEDPKSLKHSSEDPPGHLRFSMLLVKNPGVLAPLVLQEGLSLSRQTGPVTVLCLGLLWS